MNYLNNYMNNAYKTRVNIKKYIWPTHPVDAELKMKEINHNETSNLLTETELCDIRGLVPDKNIARHAVHTIVSWPMSYPT